MLDVSIILVNYNTMQMTRDCIKSIKKYTCGCSYEIILVDNASTDGSNEFFSLVKDIKYIYNDSNVGFGRANNIGLKYAKGEFVLCLNTDTLLVEDSISKMIEIARDYSIEVLGVKLVNNEGKMMHSYSPFLPSLLWELDVHCYFFSVFVALYYKVKLLFSKIIRVGYITGADLLIEKKVIDKKSFYDPDFFMYFEESEFQYRLRTQGIFPYYYSGTKIVHLEGKSTKVKENRERMYFLSRKIYYQKTHNFTYIRIINIILVCLMYLNLLYSILINKKDSIELIKFRLSLLKEN